MSELQRTLTLEATLYTLQQLEEFAATGKPHIAMAGRSNVGKSSLINALGGRRQLAKVSSTPGKTASINLYLVTPGDYYLVDLPGYGYAQRSKTEREKWAKLIDSYLKTSKDLRLLAVLLDCRLDPQQSDQDLVMYAGSLGIPVQGVLTKADKCTQKERGERVRQWRKLLRGVSPLVTAAAGPASTRIGLEQLWASLDEAVKGNVEKKMADKGLLPSPPAGD